MARMTEQEQARRECAFLKDCGFDVSNGFFSDDVTAMRQQSEENEALYDYHMKVA